MTHRIFLGEANLAADYVKDKLAARFPEFTFQIEGAQGRHIRVLGESLPLTRLEALTENLIEEFFESLERE